MKPTRFLLLFLLSVTFLSGAANHASAFYNPGSGRWLSKDPIEENGGVNLYAFVCNSPIFNFDALGLWKEKGNNKRQALAEYEAEEDDTISGLAGIRGLVSADFKKWLTPGTGKMPESADKKICGNYKVPNTVVAYWAGNGGWLGRMWTLWGSRLSELRSKGYLVDEHRYSSGSVKQELQAILTQKGNDKTLNGLYFWGHGDSEGSVYNPSGVQLLDISSFNPPYYLPLTWIYCCYGAKTIEGLGTGDGDVRGNKTGKLVPIFPGGGINW